MEGCIISKCKIKENIKEMKKKKKKKKKKGLDDKMI
jgi:hypothetical protein